MEGKLQLPAGGSGKEAAFRTRAPPRLFGLATRARALSVMEIVLPDTDSDDIPIRVRRCRLARDPGPCSALVFLN